jgi:hypothetical protein
MDRTLKNTIAVLVITVFTALAIFGTVQLTARVTGIDAVSSASAATLQTTYSSDDGSGQYGYGPNSSGQSTSGQTLTCPATGCTASYCHAGR